MKSGSIHRIIACFIEIFLRLQVDVSMKVLEDLAVMIHKAMTVQARNFHNLEHVFSFVDPNDPILTLAAFFHDIVYYHVDPGFLPEIYEMLTPYIHEEDGDVYIAKPLNPHDRVAQMTLEVFGMRCGEKLSPITGMNEFLSALVMNRKLAGILSERDLLRMTLCIEATIPFRGRTSSGESHFDLLESRSRGICEKWNILMSNTEVRESIQLAVKFANKDVESFAEEDSGKFLEGTWKLLPELNVALRYRGAYSIRDYRKAIQRMEAFLGGLDPNSVFHNHRGVPSDEEYQRLCHRAQRNVRIARQYLSIKLLAQAILEALAEDTGGDAPLSLFMGDLPVAGVRFRRLDDFLPEVPTPEWLVRSSDTDDSQAIISLLASGRQGDTDFDLKTSPLSLFLYISLNPDELKQALAHAREMFAGRLEAGDFLGKLNPPILSAIARACAAMVFTRREQLLRYVTR